MTIFIDPYHTCAGMTLDMTKVVTPLKECTIRDPLTGTNLNVRSANDIIPVFITGCRDSEKAIPSFTHPIFIKNFNGKSYLFTDMKLFVSSGATLSDLDSRIRRREEFDFTKARAIASLAWVSGDTSRFSHSLEFAGEVYATWLGQTLARNFALDFVSQHKVQLLAFGFYHSLFSEGATIYSKDEDKAMVVARKASLAFKVPFSQALQFYKEQTDPLLSIHDFCSAVVKTLDNVNLNPIEGRPETGFNFRVLLNLVSDSWFSTNSKPILAVSLEHPPTLCAIIYYCINYNNFKRQQLGQTIQSIGRGGKADRFSHSFDAMIEEYTRPDTKVIPVMEFMNPMTYLGEGDSAELSEVDKLIKDIHAEQSEFSKEINSTED